MNSFVIRSLSVRRKNVILRIYQQGSAVIGKQSRQFIQQSIRTGMILFFFVFVVNFPVLITSIIFSCVLIPEYFRCNISFSLNPVYAAMVTISCIFLCRMFARIRFISSDEKVSSFLSCILICEILLSWL